MRPVLPEASNTFVVHENANPSTDFFIAPVVGAGGRYCSFDQLPEPAELAEATVIIVRYVSEPWRTLLQQHRPARLVFFMDDDLFDWRSFRGMPWRYQRKLFRFAWRHQRWLKQMGAELWVSSPWLAVKYESWNPKVIPPANPHPPAELTPQTPMKTFFYHGSASHRDELAWLVPVVEKVLAARDDVCFEVIGDRRVKDKFGHLHGVQVVHPMGWRSYQKFIRQPRMVGLAPLLSSPFNAARSPTKFYDITAAGAVGLYADTPVYQRLVSHGANSLLLPMDQPQLWAEEIVRLLSSPARRAALFHDASRTAFPQLQESSVGQF